MKTLSSLFVFGMVIGLGAQSAHAKKLDLDALQGAWETSENVQSSLDCPMDIQVVYDTQSATFDGDDLTTPTNAPLFHFENIDKGAKIVAREAIPEHSEFQNDSVRTSTNKDSIKEEQDSDMISGNTSPMFINDPMDAPGPIVNGQLVVPQTVTDNWSITTKEVQYNAKKNLLTVSVSIGSHVIHTCAYEPK